MNAGSGGSGTVTRTTGIVGMDDPDQKLINEPVANTQDLYAALDPVVQAVLTDKNANIDSLLGAANKQVQDILDRPAN